MSDFVFVKFPLSVSVIRGQRIKTLTSVGNDRCSFASLVFVVSGVPFDSKILNVDAVIIVQTVSCIPTGNDVDYDSINSYSSLCHREGRRVYASDPLLLLHAYQKPFSSSFYVGHCLAGTKNLLDLMSGHKT